MTGLQIIENGNGYVMDGGDVYFAVDTLPTYGCLSGRKQEENRAGERVTVDNRKQNPADFALWKVSALTSGERKTLLFVNWAVSSRHEYSQVLYLFRDHLCDSVGLGGQKYFSVCQLSNPSAQMSKSGCFHMYRS